MPSCHLSVCYKNCLDIILCCVLWADPLWSLPPWPIQWLCDSLALLALTPPPLFACEHRPGCLQLCQFLHTPPRALEGSPGGSLELWGWHWGHLQTQVPPQAHLGQFLENSKQIIKPRQCCKCTVNAKASPTHLINQVFPFYWINIKMLSARH